jgi:CRISPR-associated protein (TIGR02584 family)
MHPDPLHPASYPRRIVIATLGLAPQVLTETLWCLARETEPFVPEEIHVVTTEEGRHRTVLTLLDPTSAMLAALAAELGRPELAHALTPERIHLIGAVSGAALADIDSVSDNAAAADLICDLLRELTADPMSALHVSIAGGRKTMGFLLGYALSLFGRPQDRLSHVLVAEPFQSHQQFFFPPAQPRVLNDRNGRPVSTAEAKVTLAEIPVVRLRGGLPPGLLEARTSYSGIVAEAQSALAAPEMIVDRARLSLVCGGKAVPLPAATFALAFVLAERAKRLGFEAGKLHWSEVDWRQFFDIYASLPGQRGERVANARKRIAGGSEEDFFREHVSRIRRALRQSLGATSWVYDLRSTGSKPRIGVGFGLPADAIRFVGGDPPKVYLR